jgi:hypothetical protein
MAKIIACYAVCNEANLIAQSLRSVKAYVDGYVIVDSVFTSNSIDATHSTDQTRAVCERVCKPVPLTYIEAQEKMTEQQARNTYINQVPDGDWILWLDGDEALYGDHATLCRTFKEIREGKIKGAMSCKVYTTAVLCHGLGKDVTGEQYALNPTIQTFGYQTKLYQKQKGFHHREVRISQRNGKIELAYEDACYDANDVLVTDRHSNPSDFMFVINHHVSQTHQEYVADCIWALKQRPDQLPSQG